MPAHARGQRSVARQIHAIAKNFPALHEKFKTNYKHPLILHEKMRFSGNMRGIVAFLPESIIMEMTDEFPGRTQD